MGTFIIWTVGILLLLALLMGAGWAIIALAGFLVSAIVAVLTFAWTAFLACLYPIFWILERAGVRKILALVDRRPKARFVIVDRPEPVSAQMWDQTAKRSAR